MFFKLLVQVLTKNWVVTMFKIVNADVSIISNVSKIS